MGSFLQIHLDKSYKTIISVQQDSSVYKRTSKIIKWQKQQRKTWRAHLIPCPGIHIIQIFNRSTKICTKAPIEGLAMRPHSFSLAEARKIFFNDSMISKLWCGCVGSFLLTYRTIMSSNKIRSLLYSSSPLQTPKSASCAWPSMDQKKSGDLPNALTTGRWCQFLVTSPRNCNQDVRQEQQRRELPL